MRRSIPTGPEIAQIIASRSEAALCKEVPGPSLFLAVPDRRAVGVGVAQIIPKPLLPGQSLRLSVCHCLERTGCPATSNANIVSARMIDLGRSSRTTARH